MTESATHERETGSREIIDSLVKKIVDGPELSAKTWRAMTLLGHQLGADIARTGDDYAANAHTIAALTAADERIGMPKPEEIDVASYKHGLLRGMRSVVSGVQSVHEQARIQEAEKERLAPLRGGILALIMTHGESITFEKIEQTFVTEPEEQSHWFRLDVMEALVGLNREGALSEEQQRWLSKADI